MKKIVFIAVFSQLYGMHVEGKWHLLHGSHCNHLHDEPEVTWTKEKTEAAQVEVEVAGPGTILNFIEVPGKIAVHPDCIAYVIPKVNGAVKSIRKNVGECVKKDEVLAILESKEMAEVKANYLASLKKLDLRQILLERETKLKGISPEQDYLNAKLAQEEALIALDLSKQSLYALGLTDGCIEKVLQEKKSELRFYEVRSPIDGKIVQRNLTLGELIGNTNKIYTVVDCEKVWIELNVSQINVPYLKVGLPIDIMSANGKRETTKISQFTPLISEETRMATAISVIENNFEKWTPGEFVTVKIQTNQFDSRVVVPKTAIQNMKGETTIFVEEGENFIPRVVTLGRRDENNVEVLSGLEQEERYAACNSFLIKAEYEKEEAEHSH